MTVTELYFMALAVIFFLPWFAWRMLKLDSWAPLAIVQIVSGVLLGPGLLGAAFPDIYQFVFTAPVVNSLNAVAWWAVSLFVFTAGIELNLRSAWQDRRSAGIVAGMALTVPLLAGVVLGSVLHLWPGWQGNKAEDWQFMLGIGMAMAVTALPILMVLLEKLGILRTELGQRVLRCASLDDILIWAVLALILMDWDRILHQGIFLAGYIMAAVAMRTYMPRLSHQDRWSISVIWLIVCALLADWAGLHYMVGAFLAGVIIDSEW